MPLTDDMLAYNTLRLLQNLILDICYLKFYYYFAKQCVNLKSLTITTANVSDEYFKLTWPALKESQSMQARSGNRFKKTGEFHEVNKSLRV